MFAFLTSIVFVLATEGGQSGGFTKFYNDYLNYPGFELWKFVNLALFIAALVYLTKKPLSDAFKAKREAIRAELIKAEQERQAALALLTEAEAKLAALETEKATILKRARDEAEAEKASILDQTEVEIAKMREQAEGEIKRLVQQMRADLRRFSAEKSVGLAEEKLRSRIDAATDSSLTTASIREIGGLN